MDGLKAKRPSAPRDRCQGNMFMICANEILKMRAADVKRLQKGDISHILQASAICAQLNRDLNKESLALFITYLGISRSHFSRKVGIDRISRYGEGHTSNLPTKPTVLHYISCIPHPVIEDVLRAELFTQKTTAPEVYRIALDYHNRRFKGTLRFRMRRRGVSKINRSR